MGQQRAGDGRSRISAIVESEVQTMRLRAVARLLCVSEGPGKIGAKGSDASGNTALLRALERSGTSLSTSVTSMQYSTSLFISVDLAHPVSASALHASFGSRPIQREPRRHLRPRPARR